MYSVLQHEASLRSIIERIAKVLPEPLSGAVVKHEVFGKRNSVQPSPQFEGPSADDFSFVNRFPVSEGECLAELATTEFWSAFDPLDLELRGRGSELWSQQRSVASSLLLRCINREPQPLADEIVAGMIGAMTVTDLLEFARDQKGLILALLSRNSHLVFNKDFWQRKLSSSTYQAVLDILQSAANNGQSEPKEVDTIRNRRGDG